MRASQSAEQFAIQQKLEDDLKVYMAKGGKIKDVPTGVSGYGDAKAWKFSINPSKPDQRRGRR